MTKAEEIYIRVKSNNVDLQLKWDKFLKKIPDFPISIKARDSIQGFIDVLDSINQMAPRDLSTLYHMHEKLLSSVKEVSKIASYEMADVQLNELLSTMINICQSNLNEISDYKTTYDASDFGVPTAVRLTPEENQLSKLNGQLNVLKITFAEEITKQKLTIDGISNQLKAVDEALTERLNPFISLMSDGKVYIDGKKNEIDNLMELTSGSVLAGSYSNHAKGERILSEIFRAVAICLMLGITGLIGFTLYESTTTEFDLKIALYRLAFSLVLSVPTAYFAKEASKHRQQQHLYLQTYLDLVAIDPYVAKMGESDKYRIKAMVANRIFSKTSQTSSHSDSYPINIQQLIEKLIDAIDVKPKKEKNNDD